MTRSEILAHNAGIALVVTLAARSSDALIGRLTERPTRFSYAIEALDAIVEAGAALALPLSSDGPELPAPALTKLPSPADLLDASIAQEVEAR